MLVSLIEKTKNYLYFRNTLYGLPIFEEDDVNHEVNDPGRMIDEYPEIPLEKRIKAMRELGCVSLGSDKKSDQDEIIRIAQEMFA